MRRRQDVRGHLRSEEGRLLGVLQVPLIEGVRGRASFRLGVHLRGAHLIACRGQKHTKKKTEGRARSVACNTTEQTPLRYLYKSTNWLPREWHTKDDQREEVKSENSNPLLYSCEKTGHFFITAYIVCLELPYSRTMVSPRPPETGMHPASDLEFHLEAG